MPIPTIREMNITEKTVSCPMVRVITPSAQRRPSPSVASIRSGRRISRKARKSNPATTATASAVARPLSRKAVVISSLDSAGAPVTPTRTPGNSARRPRDHGAELGDLLLIVGEGALAPRLLDEHEEQPTVRRREVAVPAAARSGRGEETAPRGLVGSRRSLEPALHLGRGAPPAGRSSASAAFVRRVRGRRSGPRRPPDLLVDALEQAVQARAGRVGGGELLVIEELVAQRRERVEGEIQEPVDARRTRGPGGR